MPLSVLENPSCSSNACARFVCSAVIHADSEAEARTEVETWENAWHDTGDMNEVVDVDLTDVCDLRASDPMDEAHVAITRRAEAWRNSGAIMKQPRVLVARCEATSFR